jgi:hypothetical protein
VVGWRLWLALAGAAAAAWAPARANGQELGHKLLGTIGVYAGTQAEPGLYILDRLIVYDADQIRDRNGRDLPIRGLDLRVVGNVFGFSFTTKIPNGPYYTAAIGAPLADVSVNADEPHLALDAGGFGDVFLQPLKLGFRFQRADVVAAYAFYAPTGAFEARTLSVGRGFWTHEASAGGAIYFGQERKGRASFLASLDFNGRKRHIDIKRGDTFQVQGGAGVRLNDALEAGLAGFALWQISDNSGSDLPLAIRGARTRVFGVGPEVSATVPALRTRFDLRAEWELGVRSRQEGWILVASAAFIAWAPPGVGAAAR